MPRDESKGSAKNGQQATSKETTSEVATSEESVAAILGRVPSGVYVLTAREGENETGVLVSWVMQAGFEPPMVSVAIRKGRYVIDWLTKVDGNVSELAGGDAPGAPFVLNVLAEGAARMLQHFGRGFGPDEPAFEGIGLNRSPSGAAILTDALGHLECEAVGRTETPDHYILLARVTGGSLAGAGKPMVHVRKDGFRY